MELYSRKKIRLDRMMRSKSLEMREVREIAYSMLRHLLHSGMDFLVHIFKLSWFSHSFPSIWKKSSVISIHEIGKPLDSPASFLQSCSSVTLGQEM